MISIHPSNDKYIAVWIAHIDQAKQARSWCYEIWQGDWGEVKFGIPNQLGLAVHYFTFHQLGHANWFKLKFDLT
jgi:hypothetical protein